MKVCNKCSKLKKLDDFYKDSSGKIGVSSYCKECINSRNKIWRKNNPEKVKDINNKRKILYSNNPEKYRKRSSEWLKNNPTNKKRRISKLINNKKIRSTPRGRINHSMETMIRMSLKENKNGRSWEGLVGYTKDDLKNHLELLFKDGMNWEEFMKGKIHIDHIKPKSLFYYTTAEEREFKDCWSLSNLQPLWARDNLTKYNHY